MAWNSPGDDDKNPWGKRPEGNKDGPPDLDAVFKKFMGSFGTKRPSGPRPVGGDGQGSSKGLGLMLGAIALVLIVLWALFGFYKVNAPEQAAVTRFGKFISVEQPGLHWYPRFIENVYKVNVDQVSSIQLTSTMLTSEENFVTVSFTVQYRIGSIKDFLFNVVNPTDSLQQVFDSAVRQVVGSSKLSEILTTSPGQGSATNVDSKSEEVKTIMQSILDSYQIGIHIVDVTMNPAKPPEQVKAAFDDVIMARENQQQLIKEAETYRSNTVPVAEGRATRFLQQAKADRDQLILQAQGKVAEFSALLPEYNKAKQVTKERMYLDTIEGVLQQSKLVLVDGGKSSNNLFYIPLDKLMANTKAVHLDTPHTTSNESKKMATNDNQNSRNAYTRFKEAQS